MNSLRTSAVSWAVSRASSGASVCTARGGTPRLRRRRSRTVRSGASSWSRRAASSAWIVGGSATCRRPILQHRRHLLDEQRVALGRREDPLRNSASGSRPPIRRCDQRSASSGVSGSSRSTPPSRAAVEQLRARHADSRIGAPVETKATCSIRSSNASSPHWMSSNTRMSGCSRATASTSLRNAQAISSVDAAPWSPSRARAVAATPVELGQARPSCVSASTTGQ